MLDEIFFDNLLLNCLANNDFFLYFLLRNIRHSGEKNSFATYNTNKINKTINSANNAIASQRAKPIIVIRKSSSRIRGLRANATTKAPKTTPIPTPDPATPIVAIPAPIAFPNCKTKKKFS